MMFQKKTPKPGELVPISAYFEPERPTIRSRVRDIWRRFRRWMKARKPEEKAEERPAASIGDWPEVSILAGLKVRS